MKGGPSRQGKLVRGVATAESDWGRAQPWAKDTVVVEWKNGDGITAGRLASPCGGLALRTRAMRERAAVSDGDGCPE